jgi:ABC-type spermidine/putrescine transport system permease subunit II
MTAWSARAWNILFGLGTACLFAFLVAPVVVVAGTSLSATTGVTFPPSGLSTRWYIALVNAPAWVDAVENSVLIATGTTVLSTTLGVTAALGIRRVDGRLADVVTGLAVVPLLVPGVVLGVTLLVFFSAFGLQQRAVTVVLAHSLWATPLTFSIMRATFSRFDWRVRDAALDLGATRLRAFREVVAPNVTAGLAAAALIAFVVSLQEFVLTLFLAGRGSRTVPVKAWNSLRNSLDPLVSVTSTLLVVAVLVVLVAVGAAVGLDRVARDTQ